MRANSCHSVCPLLLIALSIVLDVLASGVADGASYRSVFRLDPSPRPSPPNGVVAEIAAFRGGEGVARLLAQVNAVKAVEPAGKTIAEKTPEQKKRVKSAVILLSVLSGIALSGLLLIIASISIRGLQRKLSGPTRLDREPADLFPVAVPPPDLDATPAPGGPTSADPSSQETRLT